MSTINLLPWREERRQIKNRVFFTSLAIAIVSALVFIMLIHLTLAGRIEQEAMYIEELQKEQTKISAQIKEIKGLQDSKKALLHRREVIQSLQAERSLVVHFLDVLPQIIPDGIYLTQLTRNGSAVVLQGNSQTNTSISVLLKNLEDPTWRNMFENVKLNEISTGKENVGLNFTIDFVLQNPTEG
jgi:type IV pilus assembly protein PilN